MIIKIILGVVLLLAVGLLIWGLIRRSKSEEREPLDAHGTDRLMADAPHDDVPDDYDESDPCHIACKAQWDACMASTGNQETCDTRFLGCQLKCY